MFKWRSRNVLFYNKADEAIFLLQNLNDDDIADERARFALKRLAGDELHKFLMDQGYEICPEWQSKLVSASDHLMGSLYPLMSVKHQDLFEKNIEIIFGNALRYNPYAATPAYTETLNTSEY
jgi:hypothetical protein